MNKYLAQYKVSHLLAMMANNWRKPKTCKDDFKG
ncbi:MAG: short-chain dehydrogenase, partial [Candidatus Lokiarchaeota archaeon]|nr:short-chain dehydrogenase [Candidatus Lokiarchaeota archaeon]